MFKMAKEFKLSEMIYDGAIQTPHIKEFIEICLADGWDEQYVDPNEHVRAGIQFMKDRIIKNAG